MGPSLVDEVSLHHDVLVMVQSLHRLRFASWDSKRKYEVFLSKLIILLRYDPSVYSLVNIRSLENDIQLEDCDDAHDDDYEERSKSAEVSVKHLLAFVTESHWQGVEIN